MLIYEAKCKKCSGEYYFRTIDPYNGETLYCPECGGTEFIMSEPIRLPEEYGSCSTAFSGG